MAPIVKAPPANDNQKLQVDYNITWITGGFMLVIAAVFDLIQVFFTLTVFFALGTYLVDFFYMAIFPLWFYILGVPLIGGRQGGFKLASAFGGVVVELVPVFNAIPAMTASVLGIIIASRREDRMKQAARDKEPAAQPARLVPRTVKISYGPKVTVPTAANNTEEELREAA